MRYGFFTTLAEPDNRRPYGRIVRHLREQAVFCDQAGFETVWLAEHHFGAEGMGNWMFYKEVRHVKRTHPHKPKQWQQRKYWGRLNLERQDHWVFGNKQTGHHLLKYGWFPIERHILVKGTASPDDPSLKDYWHKRNAMKVKDLPASRQKIAKKQNGLCPVCKNTLFNDEELHVHHKKPKAKGGKDNYGNLVLVHSFCHQQLHAKEDVEDELVGEGSS